MKNKNLSIFHLGPGNVGKAFLQLLTRNKPMLERIYGINIRVTGIFNSKFGLYKKEGIAPDRVEKIATGLEFTRGGVSSSNIISLIRHNPKPSILIDTTSSPVSFDILLTALKSGSFVVLSNKRPLTATFPEFDKLNSFGQSRIFYETTVGA
ncbi:hypothetical protein HY338_00215, partial [Candidatus Gottesmanbacteria bacterium]|nr:hypothetical protein [Candidatus Gottesmanbacteria bacterium]